jgi:hypothetical protein
MLHEDVDIYFQKRTQVQNTFFFLGFSPVVSILLTALAIRLQRNCILLYAAALLHIKKTGDTPVCWTAHSNRRTNNEIVGYLCL